MQQQHVDNVSTLIHFMEALDDRNFSMARFKHGCGAPSCAFGWACTIPALQAQGLDATKLEEGLWPHHTAPDIFGTYHDLFASRLQFSIETPQQWASHAREWLKKRGHEVTPQTPAQQGEFKTFLESLLRPLPATELA